MVWPSCECNLVVLVYLCILVLAADGKDCLVRMVMAVEWKDLWIICMAIAVWIRKSFSVRRKGICRQIARRRLVCGTGDCKWESYLGITMH